MSIGKKVAAVGAAFAFMALIGLVAFIPDSGTPRLTLWESYEAEHDGRLISIEDTERGGNFVRIVHLEEKDRPLTWTTGHDNNGDGRWDRIFFCGQPSTVNGCNSYVIRRRANGAIRSVTWDPCPADEGRLAPLPLSYVNNAERMLDIAMVAVHRPEFRRDLLAEHQARQAT